MVKLYPPGMFRGGLQDLQDGHVRDPGNGSEVFLEVVAKIDNQDYLGFFSGAGLLAVGDGCSQQEQAADQQQLPWPAPGCLGRRGRAGCVWFAPG